MTDLCRLKSGKPSGLLVERWFDRQRPDMLTVSWDGVKLMSKPTRHYTGSLGNPWHYTGSSFGLELLKANAESSVFVNEENAFGSRPS